MHGTGIYRRRKDRQHPRHPGRGQDSAPGGAGGAAGRLRHAVYRRRAPDPLRRADAALPEGEYFDQELVGLAARDADTGEVLGTLEEVLHYPAHDIYAVRGGRDEYLVPAVPAFIAAIDVPGGAVDVRMMEGLGTHEN